MVLSNKKLKRKLRIAKAESLASEVSNGPDPDRKDQYLTNLGWNSKLEELLVAVKQRQRLSKRGKRRISQSLQESDSKGKSQDGGNSEENEDEEKKENRSLVGEGDNGESSEKKVKRKKKKRKREEGETEEKDLKEDGEVKEEKRAKKKQKKKKQQKKKKKKKKKQEEEEAKNEEAKVGGEREGVVEASKGIGKSQISDEFANKVYVGGIPYYSTEDDIRSFFEGCGTITDVDCMMFPDSGKFRGIAIISFKTEAAAKRALALDGSDMGGFYLKIQPYKTTKTNKEPNFVPQIVEGYNRIYVGNLSWDITEDDLRKFFSDCKISSIRFGMDKETGEFRGFGHIDFSDKPSLMMALKLDQWIICGRPIKISCAVPKKGANIQGTKIQSVASPTVTTDQANNIVPSTSSGKIKRRTCYECGEKGHISTACPKKQTADPTNSYKS